MMPRHRAAAVVAAVVLAALGAWWILREPSDYHDLDLRAPDDPEQSVSAIEAHLPEALDDASVPGAAVAVVLDGATAWSAGFGVTTEGSSDVTADTVFQVGSISKPIAAATIIALVEEGVLDLDQPVASRLADWPPIDDFSDPEAVTLRALLSHTAGIDTPGYQGSPADRPLPSTVESLDGADTGSPVGQSETPGEYSYSGGGFTIAQLVAEEVTGRPFAQLAEEHVFTPLGMTSSGYGCTQSDHTDPAVAPGHDDEGMPTPRYRYAEAAAAGVCTTATDLAKFAAWLASDDPPAVLMRDPADGAEGIYGLGLELYAGATVGHVGVNRGYYARMVVDSDEDVGLLVITNGDRGAEVADAAVAAWQESS
jgi:CubicO group peptidase (beta-lactamase class C family)